MLETMRAAIVHYWLLNRRGGEKVVDALCRLLPDADVFTLFCDPATLSPTLRGHRIVTSFLNPVRRQLSSFVAVDANGVGRLGPARLCPGGGRRSGPAKGVITASGTHHICYCHTPMRYLWDLY